MVAITKRAGRWQLTDERRAEREQKERFTISKDTNFQDAYNEVISGNSFMRKRRNI